MFHKSSYIYVSANNQIFSLISGDSEIQIFQTFLLSDLHYKTLFIFFKMGKGSDKQS